MHSVEGEDTISIKGGCLDPKKGDELKWSEGIHIWCKSAVVDIPEGVERWDEEPEE